MTGLERLIDQYHKKECLRYPSMPPAYIPKKKYDVKKANGLTRAIVDFVNLNGGLAERISNTGRYLKGTSVVDVIGITRNFNGSYIPGTGLNGTADISATINGCSVAIEVKIGKDRQSEAQKEYQQRIENAGGLYFIARNFEEFYEWYSAQFKH